MERPIGKAIILCDQVIEDKRTNNKSVIGIFNRISASRFPASHPRMAIYVALVNGVGKVPIELRLTCLTSSEPKRLFATEGEVEFPDPNHIVELVFDLRSVVFEEPGQYVFEVLADSGFVFEAKFDVVHVEQPR